MQEEMKKFTIQSECLEYCTYDVHYNLVLLKIAYVIEIIYKNHYYDIIPDLVHQAYCKFLKLNQNNYRH